MKKEGNVCLWYQKVIFPVGDTVGSPIKMCFEHTEDIDVKLAQTCLVTNDLLLFELQS